MPKTAFITGVTGQDGAYLSRLLLDKGYRVVGAYRGSSDLNLWRLRSLGVERDVELVSLELLEFSNVLRTIESIKPDEVYNLAAQSFVGASFEEPVYTMDVNALGPNRLLEAIRVVNPKIRFYQASTSEMFGDVREEPQSELTPFYPRSPYGVSKVCSHWLTVNYREAFDLHASAGILFNHESPLRGREFVTRKITTGLACMTLGLQDKLELGNLDAKRDWGHARDYVQAMWLMLQREVPDDFVIGTGENHTVRDFVNTASQAIGLSLTWEGEGAEECGVDSETGKVMIEVNPAFYRPAEVNSVCADPAKAHSELKWKPATSFNSLVEEMVTADVKRAKQGKIELQEPT